MKTLVLSMGMLLALPGISKAEDSPEDVVRAFYQALIHPQPEYRGQPYYRSVEPALSAPLAGALKAQVDYEQACAAVTGPGLKPHMLDQSPFFRAPDGAKAVQDVTAAVSNGAATVSVRLSYDEITWQDTVTLTLEDGRWVVADIAWEGGGTLVHRLQVFAQQPCN